jgi:Na+/H+ antiporter NhaD/arsenite permease-like protein
MIAAILVVFVIGYFAIALEHPLDINKSATALVTGVLCWTIFALAAGRPILEVEHHLMGHVSEIASIVFFLLAAMTVVELIDAHQGFQIVTDRISTSSLTRLLWVVGLLTFFLSAVLDNLTTTIVMVSILRKLIRAREARIYFVSLVVIAANAGGAFSPLGDVTTTMLWMKGQITAGSVVVNLFIPSLICLVVPVLAMNFALRKMSLASLGAAPEPAPEPGHDAHGHAHPYHVKPSHRNIIFVAGLLALLMVPVYKTLTHLPPSMGILLNLGILWVITELIHRGEERAARDPLSVVNVIRRIDVPSILFFLGILLAVGCLQVTGILGALATWLDQVVGNIKVIAVLLGLLSAVIDNVPLVAAAQGMYPLSQYPTDHELWDLIAYCAGTGGSCLIIGSAAGVAAMGMERIDFVWYAKKIGWIALSGYLAGVLWFLIVPH